MLVPGTCVTAGRHCGSPDAISGGIGIPTQLCSTSATACPADAGAGADRPPRRDRHDRVLHQRRRDASCRAAPTPTASSDVFAVDLLSRLDRDSDRLDNRWEIAMGLDYTSASGVDGAAGNPDSDGRTNVQEQAAGTHPRGAVEPVPRRGRRQRLLQDAVRASPTRRRPMRPPRAPRRRRRRFVDSDERPRAGRAPDDRVRRRDGRPRRPSFAMSSRRTRHGGRADR